MSGHRGDPARFKAATPCAFLLAVLATLSWPTPAHAYRPFNSTDAAVAAIKGIEIELGPLGYLAEGSERSLVVPSFILNWGFASRWELVLEGRQFVPIGGGATGRRSQLRDTALSLKGVLRPGSLQDGYGLSVATEVGVLLPTWRGQSGTGAQGALILSQRWRALTVHLNGTVFLSRSGEPGVSAGGILEGPGGWRVRPVAELTVEAERGTPLASSVLAGVICRVRDSLSFDAAVRLARSAGVRTTEMRAGLTWGFSL